MKSSSYLCGSAHHLLKDLIGYVDFELEPIPTVCTSVFGQDIIILDENGDWFPILNIEHIGYCEVKLVWNKRFHSSNYIEWIIRQWTIDRIQSFLDIRPIKEIILRLPEFEFNGNDIVCAENQLYSWLVKISRNTTVSTITGARLLYEWCLDEGLIGFTEIRLEDLRDYGSRLFHTSNHLVSMRDVIDGPFTRLELDLIEQKLFTLDTITPRQRALYMLCRDWGLRPIQLALLRVEDFKIDELGPYILVPSVKGIRRSRLRRSPSNMVKRYISDDTADALKNQIKAAQIQSNENRIALESLVNITRSVAISLPTPLFPYFIRSEERLTRICSQPVLIEYALHAGSLRISSEIRSLTFHLSVPNVRVKSLGREDQILQISAYRLRRTKGTSMVLGGASVEEVAEALDHKGSESVSHYFRYNLEIHEIINSAHAASPEISVAIQMWSGRVDCLNEIRSGETRIGTLGFCTLNSVCPHHPMVSCYSCSSFRPRQDSDHRASLLSLEELRSQIGCKSTGPIVNQLNAAIFGAKGLIKVIEREDGRNE